MKNAHRLAGTVVLMLIIARSVLAQEILIARPDSNGHLFTYRQHDIFWGRVYDRGRPASLIVYQSVLRAEQPEALVAFDKYQAHLKTVRRTTLVFKLFAVAVTLAGLAVGQSDRSAVWRRAAGPGVSVGVLGLSGFALYHRGQALKELKASVLAIEK